MLDVQQQPPMLVVIDTRVPDDARNVMQATAPGVEIVNAVAVPKLILPQPPALDELTP